MSQRSSGVGWATAPHTPNLPGAADPGSAISRHQSGSTRPAAEHAGHSIDGVLPDDQRRSGGFRWPPPKENYVWEALQGATLEAELLGRAGYPAWDWSDQALLRAVNWLYKVDHYPAQGDDSWLPWLIDRRYGTDFHTSAPSTPGKNFGFTDWLYGP